MPPRRGFAGTPKVVLAAVAVLVLSGRLLHPPTPPPVPAPPPPVVDAVPTWLPSPASCAESDARVSFGRVLVRAGLNFRVRVTADVARPCRLPEAAVLTLRDAAGRPLGISGNPATVRFRAVAGGPLDRAGRVTLESRWRWTSWCGPALPAGFRTTLDAGAVAISLAADHTVPVPTCAHRGARALLSPLRHPAPVR